jgi:hypothetical protein
MNRSILALIAAAVLGLTVTPVHAGPCSDEIARLEDAARRFGTNPATGPTGAQSLDAQLNRQPTPDSMRRAEQQAQSGFDVVLARAKAFDAAGKQEECMRAAAEANLLLGRN